MTINMTRSSKITVECTGMSARQLPVGIDRVTQVMVMMVMVVMVVLMVMLVVTMVVIKAPYIIVTRAGVEHDRERPAGSRRASFLIRWTFEPSKGISSQTFHISQNLLSIFLYHR